MSDAQKQAAEYAEILLAFSRGERIEYRCTNGGWICPDNPVWSFVDGEYRIAPKPVERWGVVLANGEFWATYNSKELAEKNGKNCRVILMREVTE